MDFNETISWAIAQKNARKIKKLKTGDLVKTTSDYYPFIWHYGIVEKDGDETFIIHNQPDKKNSKGGSTIKEPIGKWLRGKEIVDIEKTDLTPEGIKDLYEGLKPFKYNFFHYNCEHFVNFAKNGAYLSPQVIRYTSIAVVGIIAFLYFKNKKNGAN